MKFFITILILSLLPVASYAQPTPSSHPSRDLEKRMEREKVKKAELKKKMKSIESELKSKKQNILSITRKIQKNEKSLIELERRIKTQKAEKVKLDKRFNEDKTAIAGLISGLERMRRIPPEALIARPGAPLETAQSAMLLQSMLPNIYHRAENLRKDLDRLNTIIVELEGHQKQARTMSQSLKKNQSALSNLMAERKKLYAQTSKNVKKQEEELRKISLEASSLKDLVARIEKKQKEANRKKTIKPKAQKASVTTRPAPRPKATPIPKAGSAQLPVSGMITVSYGSRDDIGAVSKGIKISSRAGAVIVSPMGGVIDYAGPFRGYGNLIIIKHQNNYHSLIAGFDKIDTVVGQAVSAGEPLGYLSKNTSKSKPSLYYELRYKGSPVNPSKKISGLR